MQGEIFKRSALRENALYVGRVSLAGENKLVLPFSLKSYGIDEDEIRLYGNNFPLDPVGAIDEIDSERKFFLDYEENSINMHLNNNKNIKIKMLLMPYAGKILFKNEGYYIEINEPFEYEKSLITVRTTVAGSEEFEILIPKGSTRYFLPHQNISEDDFIVEIDRDGTAWEEVDTGEVSLKSASAGVLSIAGDALQYRVKYKCNKVKLLQDDEFEIWGQGSKVKGLYLYPEAVSFNDSGQPVFNLSKTSNLEHKNIVEGTVEFNNPQYETPSKEVEYIDGYSEFLNVRKMKTDFIPRIEWSPEGDVLFTIAKLPYEEGSYAGSMRLYKDGAPVEIQDRIIREGVGGIIYKLKKDGDASRHAENYHLEYYYLDEVPESIERYSIDYKNGIIHYANVPKFSSWVNYKYGDVEIEYNLYHEIKDYEVDERSDTVSVRTEGFGEGNNKIKFFWHEIENQTSLEGLEKYYTPIVYSLKMGMN